MSTRKNTDAKENVGCNAIEIFTTSLLEFLPGICCGIEYVPTTTGAVNPTERSAIAKFIRRKEVRFSLVRCFQNTNMVKKLPINTSKETKTTTNRITREAVLDMADYADAVIAVKLAGNKPFSPARIPLSVCAGINKKLSKERILMKITSY